MTRLLTIPTGQGPGRRRPVQADELASAVAAVERSRAAATEAHDSARAARQHRDAAAAYAAGVTMGTPDCDVGLRASAEAQDRRRDEDAKRRGQLLVLRAAPWVARLMEAAEEIESLLDELVPPGKDGATRVALYVRPGSLPNVAPLADSLRRQIEGDLVDVLAWAAKQ